MGQNLIEVSSGKGHRWVLPVCGIGIALIVLVVGLMPIEQTCRCGGPESHVRSRVQHQVRSICQGLILYAGNNRDNFPRHGAGLELLVHEGLVDSETLVSPLENGDGISYFFVPGTNSFDPAQPLVYENPKHHDEGVLVGFVDSHVEFVDFEQFELMIAELPEWRTPIPYVPEPVEP